MARRLRWARAGWLAVALLACGVCAAQGPSLAGVRARCALLQGYVTAATGLELAVAAQALDDCRAEAARLTPRRESKWGMLAGYLGPTLAVGQVTYAASRNMDWLETRKRQKNAGAVEFNFSGEIAVGSYLVAEIGERWWRDHKRHKRGRAAEDLQQAVTDAVLLPR